MAFTNQWDTTTPSDFELANLYAGNLRQWRLDVQQRMGAMSGLDAAKPAFGSDAQPANWNGVLYFATDTGLTYQFQNPNWINVTIFGGARAFTDQTFKSVSGTALTLVYNLSIPAIFNANSRVRITFFFYSTGAGAGGSVFLNIGLPGGTGEQTVSSVGLPGGNWNRHIIIEGGNFGSLSNQFWMWNDISAPYQAGVTTNSTVDTTNGVALPLFFQGATATDSATFYGISVEIF